MTTPSDRFRAELTRLHEDIAVLKASGRQHEERQARMERKIDTIMASINGTYWSAKILTALVALGAAACGIADYLGVR